ncbi:DNA primase [Ideonella sp. A 288]|uniref:DNA primase n=1 Tax=Ideonella sp. A 288 TaxID=1962181 RepID=UPI000B4C0150|nr:DNA primase [Ideonella sp. A 288]
MVADTLLSRLQRVRRTGPGKWIASCPTREDKCPSLAIREMDDGRVLLHDFGGDSVEAILAAVGLSFTDLYPTQPGAATKPARRPFSASDVLSLVAFESTVAVVVISDVVNGKGVTEQDFNRLLVAARRLGNAAEVCNGPR